MSISPQRILLPRARRFQRTSPRRPYHLMRYTPMDKLSTTTHRGSRCLLTRLSLMTSKRFTSKRLPTGSILTSQRLHYHRSTLMRWNRRYSGNNLGRNCSHHRHNGCVSVNRGACRLRSRLSGGLSRRAATSVPTITRYHPPTHRSGLALPTLMSNAINVGNTGIGMN
jgi:hypothetical protein